MSSKSPSVPFATKDGKPITPAPSNVRPADFSDTRQATGSGTKGGAFDVTQKNRPQERPPAGPQAPAVQPHMVNRPQPAGDPSQRIAQSSLPPDARPGRVPLPPPGPPAHTSGCGSVGNAHRPFRVK